MAATNSVNDFSPNLKTGYVQSWDIGIQRELTRDTVLEVRYVGNHGTDLWRQVNINEINIFENGFVNEFKTAQNNLALARGCASPDPVCMSANRNRSNQYFGLPGQQPLPMIFTALAANNDATSALQIEQGQAGALANAIATNATRMARLTAAGSPINLFQVNPTLTTGAANLEVNGGNTNYHGLQVEVKRRMSKGLLFQGSYVWSHSISNEQSQGIGGSYTSLRDVGYDKSASPFDIRQAVKMNWVYELPFGPRHHFLGHVSSPVARKVLEGWQLASVDALADRVAHPPDQRAPHRQPERFRRDPAQHDDEPVAGHDVDPQGQRWRPPPPAAAIGAVDYLPQSLIDNTNAAFEVNGKTLANLDPQRALHRAGGPARPTRRAHHAVRTRAAEVGFQPGQEDEHRRARQRRIPHAGAECVQPDELPAVRARQRHHHDAGRERHGLRPDVRRLPRSFEHQRSRRPHHRVQPKGEFLSSNRDISSTAARHSGPRALRIVPTHVATSTNYVLQLVLNYYLHSYFQIDDTGLM